MFVDSTIFCFRLEEAYRNTKIKPSNFVENWTANHQPGAVLKLAHICFSKILVLPEFPFVLNWALATLLILFILSSRSGRSNVNLIASCNSSPHLLITWQLALQLHLHDYTLIVPFGSFKDFCKNDILSSLKTILLINLLAYFNPKLCFNLFFV